MAHTYTNLLTHIIFSTKDREPLITAPPRDDLLAYIGGILRESGGTLRAAAARSDHVHLLCSLPPTEAISDVLRVVKTNSSLWLHRERGLRSFEWQTGYGALTSATLGRRPLCDTFRSRKSTTGSLLFRKSLSDSCRGTASPMTNGTSGLNSYAPPRLLPISMGRLSHG